MEIYNTKNTKALTIKKPNSLAVIQNITLKTVRISSKTIFLATVLTLLNLVI